MVNYEPLSLNTDLWSIGVITYIMLSGDNIANIIIATTVANTSINQKHHLHEIKQ